MPSSSPSPARCCYPQASWSPWPSPDAPGAAARCRNPGRSESAMQAHRLVRTVVVVALIVLCVPIGVATATPTTTPPSGTHVPVNAYFYQWFEKSSWQRAKQDFPLVGQYSSDDPHVLRDQINEA